MGKRIAIVLDEETTGKLDPAHRIIELSMRRYDLDSGEEQSPLLYRFDPQRNIDAKAFQVHGISLEDLKGKPLIADMFPEIIAHLRDAVLIVAHNGNGFDKPFLEMEAERTGHVLPDTPWFDTMLQGNFATELGKNPNLKELCYSLGVDYDERLAHKGDYDTDVLGQAFMAGVRQGWFVI